MLILHVGPMKTGTTAIQMGVLTKKNILKALEEDNVRHSLPYINYLVMGELRTKCLAKPINDTHCEAQQRWDDFYQKLVTARFAANNTVQNVLHSVETYAGLPDNTYTIQKLQSLQQVFDVHVIAFYRRPVSWFRSMYKQERKRLMYKSRSGRYLGYTTKDSVDLQTFHPHSRDTLKVVDYFGRVFGKDKIISEVFMHKTWPRNFSVIPFRYLLLRLVNLFETTEKSISETATTTFCLMKISL